MIADGPVEYPGGKSVTVRRRDRSATARAEVPRGRLTASGEMIREVGGPEHSLSDLSDVAFDVEVEETDNAAGFELVQPLTTRRLATNTVPTIVTRHFIFRVFLV